MRGAAVYCRISRDAAGEALGVARQEQDCRRLCEQKGWPVVEVFVDNDLSAASGRRRPAYQRLLAAIKAGRVDAVVAWDLDRLHRRPLELEEFFAACDAAGLTRLATVGGDVDLATGEGLLVARIKGAVAAEEVRKMRARVRRKHRELAEAGRWVGGRRPFGYRIVQAEGRASLAVDPVEAELVREAAQRVLAGETTGAVAADWNRRGVTTTAGTTWQWTKVGRVLTAWRLAGLRTIPATGETVAADWPSILDAATVASLRAVLLDPSRRTTTVTARSYLLVGVAVCGLCEARLVSRPRLDRTRSYVCAAGAGYRGCGKIRVVADPLEDLVAGRMFEALDSAGFRSAVADREPEVEGLLAGLAAEEAALAEAARAFFVDRTIDRVEYGAVRGPLEARVAQLRRRVAGAQREAAQGRWVGGGAGLAERWEEMGFDERRAVVLAAVRSVRVGPAVRGRNFFDPGRVSVEWAV